MDLHKYGYLTVTTVLSLFFLSFADKAFARWGGYGGWHMGTGMMGGWGSGWFGGIFLFIFWIIVGIVFLIRWLIQGNKGGLSGTFSNTSRALNILKDRYARAEIDKREFEEKKKDLLS